MTALFDLGARAGQWHAAAKLVDHQAKQKLLTADVAKRRKAVLAAAEARDLIAEGKDDAALEKANEALKIAPGMMPAALAGAEALRRRARPKKAAALLERAWSEAPHPDIAAAYPAVSPLKGARRFERLIALNPSHPESQRLSAAETAAQGRFREAEIMLQPLLAPHPLARASRLMADIALARGDRVAAGLWTERALQAPPMGRWTCGTCHGEAAGWSPVCPKCGAFDTLAWRDPGAVLEIAALPGEAVSELYRLTAPPAGAEMLPAPPDVEPPDEKPAKEG